MNAKFKTFKNNLFGRVRAFVQKDGKIWFIAKDAIAPLHFENPESLFDAMLTLVDEDDIAKVDSEALDEKSAEIISENGLLSLFVAARPDTFFYQFWITAVVLPVLRKSARDGFNAKAIPSQNVPGKDHNSLEGCQLEATKGGRL